MYKIVSWLPFAPVYRGIHLTRSTHTFIRCLGWNVLCQGKLEPHNKYPIWPCILRLSLPNTTIQSLPFPYCDSSKFAMLSLSNGRPCSHQTGCGCTSLLFLSPSYFVQISHSATPHSGFGGWAVAAKDKAPTKAPPPISPARPTVSPKKK